MTESNEERLRDLTTLDLMNATDEELRRLKGITDEELLRYSRTLDLFAVVESMRRLRKALHKEETAIKWLTVVLVVLTVTLVILGIVALRR